MSFLQSGREWSKPMPGCSINWSHPFAKGLKSLLLFNEGGGAPVDIARDVVGAINGTSDGTRWRASDRGVVGRTLATSDFWTFGSCSFLPTRQATLLLIMKKNDTTNRGAGHIGIQGNPASARRFGVHVPFSDGVVYWDFGGQTSPNRLSKSGLTVSGVNAWAFVAGTNGMAIYQNGQLVASSATAVTRTADTSNWCVNQANNATGDLCDFHFGAVLDAEWTHGQVAKWTANPYLFLNRQTVWWPLIGAVLSNPTPFATPKRFPLVEPDWPAIIHRLAWHAGIPNAAQAPPPTDPIPWYNRPWQERDVPSIEGAPKQLFNPSMLVQGGLGGDALGWLRVRSIHKADPLPPDFVPPRPFPIGVFISPPDNPRDDSRNKPFIARDPRVDPRLRRFTDMLTDLINSLIGAGYIQKQDISRWIITNPPFDETRDPFIMDDVNAGVAKGMMWYNSLTGKLWYCVRDTAGAALWIQIN